MRTLIAVVALVVGMVVYTLPPAAAVQKAGEKVAAGLAERIQDLQLTDAQEAKIAEIRKEHGPKVLEAAKELAVLLKQEVDKIRAVLTPEQQAKLAAIKEEHAEFRGERLAERLAHLKELDLTDAEVAKLMEIRKEYHGKTVKAMQGLEGLLTDEQKTARVKALDAGMKRSEVLASLKLTGDQKAKVEAVGKEVSALVRDELAKMRDVLTEAQKEKLQEFKEERREHVRDRMAHAIATFKDLNLTDAQREKIAAIRQEYRAKVHEAGNRLRADVRQEVEAIVAAIKG
jgi:Spy/CpxP family protein refolding chaperone